MGRKKASAKAAPKAASPAAAEAPVSSDTQMTPATPITTPPREDAAADFGSEGVRSPEAQLTSPVLDAELDKLRNVLASPDTHPDDIRRQAATFAKEVSTVVQDLHSNWVATHNNFVEAHDGRLDVEVSMCTTGHYFSCFCTHTVPSQRWDSAACVTPLRDFLFFSVMTVNH